jgi:hypothetical protein
MSNDLRDVSLDWAMDLARKGDGADLARLLREDVQITWIDGASDLGSEKLLKFLADVVAGKIRLPKPRKLTQKSRQDRSMRERAVVRGIAVRMGMKRDPKLRTYWTQKLCDLYGTNPNAVEAYLKTAKKRRR